MPSADKTYSPFDVVVADRVLEPSPWEPDGSFNPDYELLEMLLAIPLDTGKGAVPTALDVWVAQELRRAGFDEDHVWPRRKSPRVLGRELIPVEYAGVKDQPPGLRRALKGSVEARVLGEFYEKQIDVLMAHWDRGAEFMVSTKTQLGSYGKNLHNRFEEYVGDIRNLRGRFPMASMGVLHLVHSNIDSEAGAWDFTVDMMRKLQTEPQGYDATCALVADWEGDSGPVHLMLDRTPADLGASSLFTRMIHALLERTPITTHVAARELLPQVAAAPKGDLDKLLESEERDS